MIPIFNPCCTNYKAKIFIWTSQNIYLDISDYTVSDTDRIFKINCMWDKTEFIFYS